MAGSGDKGASPSLLGVPAPVFCRCCPNKSPMVDKPVLCPVCNATYHHGCAKKCALAPNGGFNKCCGTRSLSPAQPQQVVLSREDLDSLISGHFKKISAGQEELKASVDNYGGNLQAIQQEQRLLHESLNNAVADLSSKIETTNKRYDELAKKTVETDVAVKNIQGQVLSLSESVADLRATVENPGAASNLGSDFEERIMREVELRSRKSMNIRLFDLPEAGDDRETVVNLLRPLNIRLDGIHVTRLGARPVVGDGAHPRAILVSLGSWADVNSVMRNRSRLKIGDRTVPVGTDRTEMQKDQLKKARADLERRKQAGELNLTIKYLHGVPKIISTEASAAAKN